MTARSAFAETQVIDPAEGYLAMQAGRMAETAGYRQHIRQVVDQPPREPAKDQGKDKRDIHAPIIAQVKPLRIHNSVIFSGFPGEVARLELPEQ